MNKNTEEVKEVKEEVKNEETKEEKKEEVKNEETQKSSKSFLDTMSGIWNSKPVKFLRKTVKVTAITGAALIGITGAAKAGCTMALEERDMKASGDSDSEIPDEIPAEDSEVPDIPEDSENSES